MHERSKMMRVVSIVLGVIIGIGVIFLGFGFLQRVFTQASDMSPADVVISDITQNSVKITWTTGVETQGVVEYGTTPTALNFFAPEAQRTKQHSVDLTLLSPQTQYYFQIRIADNKYDNGNVPWMFTTKGSDASTTATPSGVISSPVPTQLPVQVPQGPTSTPIQTLQIPPEEGSAPAPNVTCGETDCNKIKEKIGKGCQVSDWTACINKPTATPTP